jgi:hypothetical protein
MTYTLPNKTREQREANERKTEIELATRIFEGGNKISFFSSTFGSARIDTARLINNALDIRKSSIALQSHEGRAIARLIERGIVTRSYEPAPSHCAALYYELKQDPWLDFMECN